MSNVVTTAAQPEGSNRGNNNPLPGRDMINQAQVNSVLHIFGATASVLLQSANLEEESGGKLDGGARTAVEATLIKACDRLDALLDDVPRWTLEISNSLEAKLAVIYDENARMLSAQADAYAEITSPHHRLKPQMVKLEDGTWVAFCGDPTNLDNAMVGAGTCPQNALEAFDALFKGEIPPHLAEWLSQREASIAAGAPPLEFKQQQQQNDEKKSKPLDESRPEKPENAPKKRKLTWKHRPSDGAKPGVD
jgi:hypothetical protein